MKFQANLFKKLNIHLLFAKPIWLATGGGSLIIWSSFGFKADKTFALFFGFTLLIKVLINSIIYWLYHQSKTERYLFYQNLGISKSALWIFTHSIDFLLFPLSVYIFSITL
jgi:hypothetical protein